MLLSLLCITNAFTIPRSYNQWNVIVSRLTSDEYSSLPTQAPSLDNDALKAKWSKQIASREIQEVRTELVAKYVHLGKTHEEAEVEVDRFLSDPEQSHQYLEMRRSAKSQELVGPELLVQLAGAFAVGWLVAAQR